MNDSSDNNEEVQENSETVCDEKQTNINSDSNIEIGMKILYGVIMFISFWVFIIQSCEDNGIIMTAIMSPLYIGKALLWPLFLFSKCSS